MIDSEPIGAVVDRPGWNEHTLRALIRLNVPGVPCPTCSIGKLHTEGNRLSSRFVYHPANRPCTTVMTWEAITEVAPNG